MEDDDDDEDTDEGSDEPGYRSIGTQRDSDSEDSESIGTPDEGGPSHILPPKYGVLKNRFKRQRTSYGDSDSDSIASMGSPSLSSLAAVAAAVAAGAYLDSPLSLLVFSSFFIHCGQPSFFPAGHQPLALSHRDPGSRGSIFDARLPPSAIFRNDIRAIPESSHMSLSPLQGSETPLDITTDKSPSTCYPKLSVSRTSLVYSPSFLGLHAFISDKLVGHYSSQN